MNPKPFSSLNHFTVPVATLLLSPGVEHRPSYCHFASERKDISRTADESNTRSATWETLEPSPHFVFSTSKDIPFVPVLQNRFGLDRIFAIPDRRPCPEIPFAIALGGPYNRKSLLQKV